MAPHFSLRDLLGKPPSQGNLAVSVFSHNDVEVELYEPKDIDRQTPHERDEIYIIARGNGTFVMQAGAEVAFSPGDMLFVPANLEHRFIQFSNDFATWVFFFGKGRDV